MRCVQEYPHIMTVKQSDSYKRLGDSFWTPENVYTVWNEASTGKIPVKGMGYKGAFAGEGFDGMWTDMSEIVRPTRDGVYGREYISTSVDIGREPTSIDFARIDDQPKSLEIPVPIIFDELPTGTDTADIRAAVRSISASGKLVEDYGNRDLQRLRLIIDPSKVDAGWFTSNVDACRDVLPTIHPISSWANYLRHVRPHVVKPLSCKRALVAHALDWDLPGRSFIPYRVDVLGGPERITEPLVTVRLFNRHDVRVFLDASHASDAFVLQRFESAEAATKDPVDARPAKHNFLVQPVFEGLVKKHCCEAQLAGAHIKLVRNLIDVRSRLWLELG